MTTGDLQFQVGELIPRDQLRMAFGFSQMTVINEKQNEERYGRLTYVEFLEMLCRAALRSDESSQPVYAKVQDLLAELCGRLARMEPKFEGLRPFVLGEDDAKGTKDDGKTLEVFQATVIE